MVLIEEATRKPAPLTAELVSAFQPWLRRGIEVVPQNIDSASEGPRE
jgi:acyl-CoA thioester hydrolase